jgi:hypothetical protein
LTTLSRTGTGIGTALFLLDRNQTEAGGRKATRRVRQPNSLIHQREPRRVDCLGRSRGSRESIVARIIGHGFPALQAPRLEKKEIALPAMPTGLRGRRLEKLGKSRLSEKADFLTI